jgi:MYXO-CTERM domain-containing protein
MADYSGSGSVPHLAPGDAGIGTLTLGSTLSIGANNALDYKLNNPGQAGTDGASSLVAGVTTLTLGSSSTVNITPGPNFGVGNYDLIDYTTGVVGGANLSGWTVNGLTGDTYTLNTGADPTTGATALYLNVTAVPEPAAFGLVAIASIGLLRRRRRA